MLKRFAACILTALLISCSLPVSADTGDPAETLIREQTFETSEPADRYEYPFENEIRENGKNYALDSVKYEVVSEQKTTKEETLTDEIRFEDLDEQNCDAEETIRKMVDGEAVIFTLKDTEYIQENQGGRTAVVSSSVDYGLQTATPVAENTRSVTYYDHATGINVAASIPLASTKSATGWRWVQDVSIPITYKVYNAKYYEFEGKLIPFDDAVPQIDSIKEDILSYLELDDRYRIDSVRWVSDVYTEDGIEYRNAEASESRWAADFTANYSGTVQLPDLPRYTAVVKYEAVREVPTGEVIKTVKAIASYRLISEESAGLSTETKIMIGIGIALLAAAVIFILVLIAKRKKSKRGQTNYAGH